MRVGSGVARVVEGASCGNDFGGHGEGGMNVTESYTASSGGVTAYVFVARPWTIRERLRNRLAYRLACMVGYAMATTCSMFGHFLWMHDRNDEEHPFACWILGGPELRGRRGKLYVWATERPRYRLRGRFETVAP